MISGWVISVTDLLVKDKAYKAYPTKTRQEVNDKVKTLSQKYKDHYSETNRFAINIVAPFSEFEFHNRIRISSLREDVNTADKLLSELYELNPILIGDVNSDVLHFEIDRVENLPAHFKLSN